jgi:hypothetical protein
MKPRREIEIETLKSVLAYNSDSGALVWKQRPRSMFKSDGSYRAFCSRFAGRRAFTAVLHADTDNPYFVGNLFGQTFRAHRVVWALHYGEWPDQDIDHINGDTLDNRACNLRVVSHTDNMRNMKKKKVNTSGVVGVSKTTCKTKWRARIYDGANEVHLGRFDSFDGAVAARKAAEIELGYHENHGQR